MDAEPATRHEEFFIRKINQGLPYDSPLTPDQERLLRSPVMHLSPEDRDALTQLNGLAVTALRRAYERDTSLEFTEGMSGHARRKLINEPMEEWKRHNKRIYETSENVITGIVQNWYLEGGRQQEVRAAKSILPGCLPIIGFLFDIQ